jgi:hypothetical protein
VIALFLDSHPVVQIAFVVGTLVVVFLAGLLVWAYLWPLGDECQRECCAEVDAPPSFKEFPHE